VSVRLKTQLSQLQNALQSKRYDGWLVSPVDGRQECAQATKEAPQGASKYSVAQVKVGKLVATGEYIASAAGKDSIDSLVNAFERKRGPRFVDVQAHGSTQPPHLVTKRNVASYRADY
jgi:ABC-type amino acid transport substrate-binding protein